MWVWFHHCAMENNLNRFGTAKRHVSKAIRPFLCLAILVIAVMQMPTQSTRAQSSPIVATPPMGWNSWNHFGAKVSDADVRAATDAMVTSGMRDAGYVYVIIDDGWEGQRDPGGNIRSNQKFPNMQALADYVHSKGLKLGIYSSPGPTTCAGNPGSYGHEQQDANTFARWGVDYLKYDLCSYESIMNMWDMEHPNMPVSQTQHGEALVMMENAYSKMHRALQNTHRPIVYSICQYGIGEVWQWGAEVGGNLWRTTDDIRDNYSRHGADRLFAGKIGALCRTRSLERSGHAGGRKWRNDS